MEIIKTHIHIQTREEMEKLCITGCIQIVILIPHVGPERTSQTGDRLLLHQEKPAGIDSMCWIILRVEIQPLRYPGDQKQSNLQEEERTLRWNPKNQHMMNRVILPAGAIRAENLKILQEKPEKLKIQKQLKKAGKGNSCCFHSHKPFAATCGGLSEYKSPGVKIFLTNWVFQEDLGVTSFSTLSDKFLKKSEIFGRTNSFVNE